MNLEIKCKRCKGKGKIVIRSKNLEKVIGYKVVYRNKKDRLLSAYLATIYFWRKEAKPFIRKYSTEKYTHPAKGTKLFAFLSLEEAKKYSCSIKGAEIWKAELINPIKGIWLGCRIISLLLTQELFKEKASCTRSPVEFKSNVNCDAIKLIEKVV